VKAMAFNIKCICEKHKVKKWTRFRLEEVCKKHKPLLYWLSCKIMII
jgi:hypothetical protein